MHKAKKKFGRTFWSMKTSSVILSVRFVPSRMIIWLRSVPGLGALTRPLMKKLRHLHVVEIDRDIISRLENDYPQPHTKLTIHAGDALKFDLTTLAAPLRIVGNLPYNISSPLLFYFAEYAERITDMHFMLQNEVVERMVAEHSTPAYGRLSVMLQYRFYMEKLLDVPPESFRPAPKVDSAIVRMIPLPPEQIIVKNEQLFREIVGTAFGQRRKTLRNTLKSYLSEAEFEQLGINPQLRAENLSVADFAKIVAYVDGRGAQR